MGNCCSHPPKKEDPPLHTREFMPPKKIPFYSGNMSNHYTVNYPFHEKREDSATYRKTKKEMSHIPCFICGKMKGVGDTSLEAHHFYIEKAATNAIDWSTFGTFADQSYHIQTGEKIGGSFDWKEVEKNPELFVDSRHNMIVLCKEHHISGRFGIHHVPFPDWILQKFAVEGFKFLS
jgi:hypothetical protein